MTPRLHVLLARDSPAAVVLRRGPSEAVASIGWDRTTDRFALGQWLRGRIYERRCDLSPDGEHLLYFARGRSATMSSWTAVSRAPYLHAIALFHNHGGYRGGGLFLDVGSYWLNGECIHTLVRDTRELVRAERAPYASTPGRASLGVYFHRLLRDGWTRRPELSPDRIYLGSNMEVFERVLPHGWVLRKLAIEALEPGKPIDHDEHELVGPGGRELLRHAWEWADVDGDRVVWAEAGALWAGRITAASSELEDPIEGATRLHDFSAMTFEAIRAPYDDRSDLERAATRSRRAASAGKTPRATPAPAKKRERAKRGKDARRVKRVAHKPAGRRK